MYNTCNSFVWWKDYKVIQYVEDQFSGSCISEKVAKCGGEVNSLIKKCVTLIIANLRSYPPSPIFRRKKNNKNNNNNNTPNRRLNNCKSCESRNAKFVSDPLFTSFTFYLSKQHVICLILTLTSFLHKILPHSKEVRAFIVEIRCARGVQAVILCLRSNHSVPCEQLVSTSYAKRERIPLA